ncbi:hypothetical protein BHE74_00004873 [Ensete ventricosum]|nr:hypothetical protein BHE74_00004873 [Ensete ventricosum]
MQVQINHALLEEIREINLQLVDTVVSISVEETDSGSAALEGEGTVIKCSFTAVAFCESLKSQFASEHMSPILPLRLLVPVSYPKSSPVLLDKLPDDQRLEKYYNYLLATINIQETESFLIFRCDGRESDDLSVKAKSRFIISLRALSQPMSLGEMARTWDACVRKVITEFAQQTGGGTFSSRYGAWENCVSA